jgi:pyruvate kinase
MPLQVIATAPPYADYLAEVVRHPLICGLRLNTVMPFRESHEEVLSRFNQFKIAVWVDLKGRQLRVTEAAVPPFTEVKISHKITVHTPADVYFSDGTEHGQLVAVDGDRLILENGPRRVIGPGESVNILHPSLKVLGTLTETDKAYLQAMQSLGMTKVLLSYVESPTDIEEIKDHLPNAEVMLKIESHRGLAFVRNYGHEYGRLIAARGDLFTEISKPHKIISALRDIIRADPNAIAASRILDSMAFHPVPVSAEINDVAYLWTLGYHTLMLGDAVCLNRDSLIETLNLLQQISKEIAA